MNKFNSYTFFMERLEYYRYMYPQMSEEDCQDCADMDTFAEERRNEEYDAQF